MKFAATILYVPDVVTALEFYERAFGFSRAFVSDEGDYGELDTGDVRLAFDAETLADETLPAGYRPNRRDEPPPAIEVMLATDDVEIAVRQAIGAGAQLLAPQRKMPWGQTIAYVRDPWGALVAVGTPWQPTRSEKHTSPDVHP
jgi:lactoylglutathione lyase